MNFLLALRRRREGAVHVESLPFDLTLDPATFCQLSCPYCSTGNQTIKRTKAVMSEAFHRSLMEAMGDEVFFLHYFSSGEPLLNKHLPQIVQCSREKKFFRSFPPISA